MAKHKKMRALLVIGRRWFQKKYGNTYHSAQVFVNGESVYKSGEHYGYGDQYLQTAEAWLEVEKYLPGIEHFQSGGTESLWQYCERVGITFRYETVDVSREKDL